ncbi:hypothetical protein Pcinc_019885 [Petrolisthes cinctipes]|uniref:Uncharacterized protein n=1 Tax=Petrolisthes cinctipes TaxID=88211 RepID=A0AAE1FK52_PETCI|nr:hypothetical protein Pcinc_019885 [Petrolisthes cinctipes]
MYRGVKTRQTVLEWRWGCIRALRGVPSSSTLFDELTEDVRHVGTPWDMMYADVVLVGYNGPSTHGRDPTTARHGCFWLLGFPPGPVHTSLDNLDAPDSPRVAILMPELSADTHSTWKEPLQDSYPQAIQGPSFRVAGLQDCATSPSW